MHHPSSVCNLAEVILIGSTPMDLDETVVDSGRSQGADLLLTSEDLDSLLAQSGLDLLASEPAGSKPDSSMPIKDTASIPCTSQDVKHHPDFCLRLVAVDVLDDPTARVKDVRCLDPLDGSLSWRCSGGGFRHVLLSGCWYDTDIAGGDVLHVLLLGESDFWVNGFSAPSTDLFQPIVVNDKRCLLVHHPDTLISPSKVVDSLSCPRRSLLSSRYPGLEGPSANAVMGALKHDCIGQVVAEVWRTLSDRSRLKTAGRPEGLIGKAFLESVVVEAIANKKEDILACSLDPEIISKDLRSLEPNAIAFARRAFYDLSACKENTNTPEAIEAYALKEVVAIEESFCTPAVGIRGQIDLIARGRRKSSDASNRGMLFPIELKTGARRSASLLPHKAQVILYILALRIRELSAVSACITDLAAPRCGVLLYLNAEGFDYDIITPDWEDVKQLILARNLIALYSKRAEEATSNSPLPPMLRSVNECSRCFRAAECMVTHAALENGSPESSGVPELFKYSTRVMSKAHLEYIDHWSRLVELEAGVTESGLCRIWTRSGRDLEHGGEATVIGLVFQNMQTTEKGGSRLAFVRSLGIPQMFEVGDRVQLSAEMRSNSPITKNQRDIEDLIKFEVSAVESCVCSGHVAEVSQGMIAVDVPSVHARLTKALKTRGVSIRIDKDGSSVGMGSLRSNIMRLFTQSHSYEIFSKVISGKDGDVAQQIGPVRLRELVVDRATPEFEDNVPEGLLMFRPDNLNAHLYLDLIPLMENALRKGDSRTAVHVVGGLSIYPGCNPVQLFAEFNALNPGQQEAVLKAIRAKDYLLILGVPGSGKTTALSFLARALIAKGKRVMIAAYTNAAVDNLLLKLRDAGLTPALACRVGNSSAIHSGLQDFVFPPSTGTDIGGFNSMWQGMRLVATTVLTASSKSFMRELTGFDNGIVDEAGQVVTPAVLGALLRVKTFCLVGDYYQLPPLVSSKEALRRGMDVSLFKTLAEEHPQAVVTLSCQYRMNADIMTLSNSLIYEHRLQCPDPAVACGRIVIPDMKGLCQMIPNDRPAEWLLQALNPENAVLLVDTDSLKMNKVK